jgi:hypothetical protein
MFPTNKAADKLATALADYQQEFERSLQAVPNRDAAEAQERINRAKALVDQSGLGQALVTLLEHTKHWPTWSQRDDFKHWVGFPIEEVLAKEQRTQEKYSSTKTIIVLFIYRGGRYGIVFTDNGTTSMPDGDLFRSGKVEFVANGEIVLGLDVHLDNGEFAQWHYFTVNALNMGPWSKALIEIAAHIRAHERDRSAERHDDMTISQAKNIRI